MRIKKFRYRKSVLTGVVFLSMVLTSCGVVSRTANPIAGIRSAGNVLPPNTIQQQLYTAHDKWEGTPYVLGGSGVNGVDCSSFMQIVFDDYFNLPMPRHTTEQLQVGQGIRRQDIQSGDLVFFRTTGTDLHVGVVINNSEFLHASTSSGVMISNLEEVYWAMRYLGARRVLI